MDDKIKKIAAGVDGLLERIADKSEPFYSGQATGLNYVKALLQDTFPELKESEDERIRKWIVNYIHYGAFNEEERPMALKAIEWLEKQKEQKPYQEVLSDSENRMLDYHASLVRGEERKPFAHENDFVSKSKGYIENAAHNYAMNFGDKESELYIEIFDAYKAGAYYAELRQKPAEWSDEDENALKYLHELIGFGYSKKFMDAQTAADMRKWVNNSLRSRPKSSPHWKPSEEQPEVEFEEEWEKFEDWVESYNQGDYPTCYEPKQIARHFYELGRLNARKEEKS